MNVHVQQLRFPAHMDEIHCLREIRKYLEYAINDLSYIQMRGINAQSHREYDLFDKKESLIGRVTVSPMTRAGEDDPYKHHLVIIETRATIKP